MSWVSKTLTWLDRVDDNDQTDLPEINQEDEEIEQISTDPSPQDRRGFLTPKQRVDIPISAPSLVSSKGYIFYPGQTADPNWPKGYECGTGN